MTARLKRDAKGRWTKPKRKSLAAIAREVAASRRITIVATALATLVVSLAIAQRPGAPAAAPAIAAPSSPCAAAAAPAEARPQRPIAPRQWPATITCYYGYRKGPC